MLHAICQSPCCARGVHGACRWCVRRTTYRSVESTQCQPPSMKTPTPMGPDRHVDPSSGEHSPNADVYSCRMHPQVREPKPGKCPICGMTLVKRPAKQGEERQP